MKTLTLRACEICSIAFTCVSMCFSHVAAEDLSSSYRSCIDHHTSNADWSACGSSEMTLQDVRLNKAWKNVMLCLNTGDLKVPRERLLEEQRLWIKWKEASCEFYAAPNANGTPAFGREGIVLDALGCKADIISDRATQLEGIAKDVCDR